MTVGELTQALTGYRLDTPIHVIEWNQQGDPYPCELNTVAHMKKARNVYGWPCLEPTGTGRGKLVVYFSNPSIDRDRGVGTGGRHEQLGKESGLRKGAGGAT